MTIIRVMPISSELLVTSRDVPSSCFRSSPLVDQEIAGNSSLLSADYALYVSGEHPKVPTATKKHLDESSDPAQEDEGAWALVGTVPSSAVTHPCSKLDGGPREEATERRRGKAARQRQEEEEGGSI